MSKKTKCLALMGRLPLDKRFLDRTNRHVGPEKQLARDGWVEGGGGFDSRSETVYRSYFKSEHIDVPLSSAIPHFPSFAVTPDYWMYGKMEIRTYKHYFPYSDSTEDRGFTYHRLSETKVFNDNYNYCNRSRRF
jgi:hypothetical protein